MEIKTEKPLKAKPQFYSIVFEPLKAIAIKHGYNLLIHGSLDRDLDLLATPWVDDPKSHEVVLKEFCDYLGVNYLTDTNGLPCHYSKLGGGRSSYVINLNRGGKWNNYDDKQYYIDLSFTANSHIFEDWILTDAPTKLTQNQKLEALALKHYSGLEWIPKKEDYYTTSRNDLQLYQIVDENETHFFTNYCDPHMKTENPEPWEKDDFLKRFGERRVYVPDFVLKNP